MITVNVEKLTSLINYHCQRMPVDKRTMIVSPYFYQANKVLPWLQEMFPKMLQEDMALSHLLVDKPDSYYSQPQRDRDQPTQIQISQPRGKMDHDQYLLNWQKGYYEMTVTVRTDTIRISIDIVCVRNLESGEEIPKFYQSTRKANCPYCTEKVGEDRVECLTCGAIYHEGCADQITQCARLGCVNSI